MRNRAFFFASYEGRAAAASRSPPSSTSPHNLHGLRPPLKLRPSSTLFRKQTAQSRPMGILPSSLERPRTRVRSMREVCVLTTTSATKSFCSRGTIKRRPIS